MRVKFHQLPVGARFAYRGDTLEKISPLKARFEGADERQKLIPRSAQVERILGEQAAGAPKLPERLSGESVERALRRLLDRCRYAATQIDPPLEPRQQTQLAAAIEIEARDLLHNLSER